MSSIYLRSYDDNEIEPIPRVSQIRKFVKYNSPRNHFYHYLKGINGSEDIPRRWKVN